MRRRLFTLAAIGLGLLIGAVLVEATLRAIGPANAGLRAWLYQSTLPTRYDRITTLAGLLDTTFLGFRPRTAADGYVLNSRSLRTREYTVAKTPGTYRVAALGDSFTFGSVPDADDWCNLLEAGLAAARGPAEVLRLGVPATGPPFYLRMWQIEARHLQPDLVIVSLFVGNDFFDEAPRPAGLVERAAALSYTVRLARNLLRVQTSLPARQGGTTPAVAPRVVYERGGFPVKEWEAAFDEARPTLAREAFLRIERERLSLCDRSAWVAFNVRLDRVMRLVRALHAEVTGAGGRLLVLIVPDEYQVDAALIGELVEQEGRRLEDYDLERPQRELSRALAREQIATVDLLPAFRSKGAGQRLYLVQDTHWNRAGHRLAAETLLAALGRIEP